jgi:hypothetical protein
MKRQTISFPQRKIQKSYRSVTGHFPSIKNNRNIAYESILERNLFLTLEFNKEVDSYIEQPQIDIQHNEKTKIYSADCYVKYIESSTKSDAIIEAKYISELEKKKVELEIKFNNIQNAVDEINLDFILFTDETFTDIYVNNLDFLYRYQQQEISDEFNEDILASITKDPITSFDLANSLSKTKHEYFQVSNAIWSLVMQGKLCADLHKEEITMNTLIWRSDECHYI